MVGYTKFNRPIQASYKNFEKRRRVQKQTRKKSKGVKIIPVADPELMTSHILKKRLTNPRANITLSGKKKHKILKQLRKVQTEKLQMEVDSESISVNKTKKLQRIRRKRPAKSKKVKRDDVDVEMKE